MSFQPAQVRFLILKIIILFEGKRDGRTGTPERVNVVVKEALHSFLKTIELF